MLTVEASKRRSVEAVLGVLMIIGCASSGDPPGGPEDRVAPLVARVAPDSGAVITTPPREAEIWFDEVINERTVGTPTDLAGAILLSPTTEPERVSWHRDHITVRPKSGFVAGRVYRIELLPVITDLRNNRMRAGRTIVFSTGPEIPNALIEGSVVDWVAGRPAARALIEAVLMPDSLVYRAMADSGGVFRLGQLPPGHYRVYGVMDSNNDKRRGAREIYDSAGVDIDSVTAPLELFAFLRDTTGPRLRQVEITDSVTLKLTFDRPLDPTLPLDTSMVTVAALEDSTTPLPIAGVFMAKGADSLRARLADSATAARAATADSVRPAADTGRGRARAPLDSTRAERMLARRPPPTDVRIIKLATPLLPDTRYVVFVRGVRSLSGNPNDPRGQVRAPRAVVPRDRGTGGRDTTAVRDSVPQSPSPPVPRP